MCFSLIREQYNCIDNYSAELTYTGLSITLRGRYRALKDGKMKRSVQFGLLLAERIIIIHGGDFTLEKNYCRVTLPYPTLTGQKPSKHPITLKDQILVLSDPASLPGNFFSLSQIRDTDQISFNRVAFITWNAAEAKPNDMVKVSSLRWKKELADIPFLCYGMPVSSDGLFSPPVSLVDAIELMLTSKKTGVILFIGHRSLYPEQFILSKPVSQVKNSILGMDDYEEIHIESMSLFNETVNNLYPLLIVFNTLDTEGITTVRQNPLTAAVPVLIIISIIDNPIKVTALGKFSRLLICHKAVVTSPEFRIRIQALINGDDILPPYTGLLVKKVILYFDQNAKSHISRLKLAELINASEDYITRIFHKEMGISMWNYLIRYRLFLATELLQQTDDTIHNIACKTGFQDQAYFFRVFKKFCGVSPRQFLKQLENVTENKPAAK